MASPAEVQALAAPLSMAERWSMPSSVEGSYLLADPLTGQRLDAERPPIWIEKDEVLASGFAYLRDNATDLHLTVLYGSHGTHRDLGDPSKGWYERQVAAASFYGYEAVRSTQKGLARERRIAREVIQDAMSASQAPTLEHFLAYARKRNCSTFTLRRLAAVTLINTPSFTADMTADGSVAEQALSAAVDPLLRHPDQQAAGLAHVGLQNAREWIGVARTGVELKALFGGLSGSLKGFITFGKEHKDLSRKFGLQGVEVNTKSVATSEADVFAYFDLPAMLQSGIVLPDELGLTSALAKEMQNHL